MGTCSPRIANRVTSRVCHEPREESSAVRSIVAISAPSKPRHDSSTSSAACSRNRLKSSSSTDGSSSQLTNEDGRVHCPSQTCASRRYRGARRLSCRSTTGVSCRPAQKSTVSSARRSSAPAHSSISSTRQSNGPCVTATMSTARSANAASTRQKPSTRSSASARVLASADRPSWDAISSNCAARLSTAPRASAGAAELSGLLVAENRSVSASAAAALRGRASGAVSPWRAAARSGPWREQRASKETPACSASQPCRARMHPRHASAERVALASRAARSWGTSGSSSARPVEPPSVASSSSQTASGSAASSSSVTPARPSPSAPSIDSASCAVCPAKPEVRAAAAATAKQSRLATWPGGPLALALPPSVHVRHMRSYSARRASSDSRCHSERTFR
eukprot:scaffold1798_cov118-Isochrysis_galbana.AAC.10